MNKPQQYLLWFIWEKYSNKNRSAVESAMTYQRYHPEFYKKNVLDALLMWNFARALNDDGFDNEEKMFFDAFVHDENQPFRMRAAILTELLPVHIFRKVLWTANIDYQSRESFFRRLTLLQFNELLLAYYQWQEGQLPDIYRTTWIDRLMAWFKIITLAKITAENDDLEETRHYAKSAWSFNLFGLDFGFAQYPNGIDDDYAITEDDPRRFLALKNKINDFSVNQFDGKYWFLYRFVRSALVMQPRKFSQVKMKPAICPGFWYTMFSLLFWFMLVPVWFVWVVSTFGQDFSWLLNGLRGAGIFYMAWFMYAWVSWMRTDLKAPDPDSETREKLVKRNLQRVAIGLFTILMLGVVAVRVIDLSHLVSVTGAFLLLGALYCYGIGLLGAFIPFEKCNTSDMRKNVPTWTKRLLQISVVVALGIFMDRIGMAFIGKFLMQSIFWMLDVLEIMQIFVSDHPLVFLILVGITVFIIAIGRINILAYRDEERFVLMNEQWGTTLRNIAGIMLLISIIVYAKEFIELGQLNLIAIIIGITPLVLVGILLWWHSKKEQRINRETLQARQLAREVRACLAKEFPHEEILFSFSFSVDSLEEWVKLHPMEAPHYESLIKRMKDYCEKFLGENKNIYDIRWFLRILFSQRDIEGSMTLLAKHWRNIRNITLGNSERLVALSKMLEEYQDHSSEWEGLYEQLGSHLTDYRTRKYQEEQKMTSFLTKVKNFGKWGTVFVWGPFWVVYQLMKKLWFGLKYAWGVITQLRFMNEFLNERCPHVDIEPKEVK